MANFDWGLLGDLLKRDREEWGAMPYDGTQPYNGVAADWLNAANNAVSNEALTQGLLGEQVKPAEAKAPETSKPASLPIMTPQQPQQQEQPEVTQQVNPVNQDPGGQQEKAEALANVGGGGATEGSQAMAASAKKADEDGAASAKMVEANREKSMEEASSLSQQLHQQKLQEEQSFESFLGGLLGLGLNSLIPGSFFLKKAGIMHK